MSFRFGDLPHPYYDRAASKAVIVPVPYDGTSTWGKGADKGPGAIIKASVHMELYDIETGREIYKIGIHTDQELGVSPDPAVMVDQVRKRVAGWLDQQKFVVTLGGEHSISIGAIQAHHHHYPDMSVLQLDAHTDLREEYEGSPFNHACVMARVKELCPVTHVGIRSMDSSELSSAESGRVFYQEAIKDQTGWIDQVLETLSGKVYLTLDLDVLDPAIMPSTGTPEPGGMDWYSVLRLARKVAEKRKIVGLDVVELCPNPHNKAPDFLAAKLIYKILGYCLNEPPQ
jgi:agmatinase